MIVCSHMEHTEDNMQVYEAGFLLVPTLPEEKLPGEFDAIKKLVSEHGGTIISEEMPKSRSLSYSMTKVVETKRYKFNEAYFGWVKFELSRSALAEVEKGLKVNTSVLRYLLIKTVRENTLYTPRIIKKATEDGEVTEGEPALAPVDIDKSIDALVI
jgi:ribosomal protein S6